MSDDREHPAGPRPEGWRIAWKPPVFGALLLLIVLSGGVWGFGALYMRHPIRDVRATMHRFSDPGLDMRLRSQQTPAPTRRIDERRLRQAMAEIAAEGDRAWSGS